MPSTPPYPLPADRPAATDRDLSDPDCRRVLRRLLRCSGFSGLSGADLLPEVDYSSARLGETLGALYRLGRLGLIVDASGRVRYGAAR